MMNCLALAGNGTGAAGFAMAKAVDAADAIEKAVARVPTELIPIERTFNVDPILTFSNLFLSFFLSFFWNGSSRAVLPNGAPCTMPSMTFCELVGLWSEGGERQGD